MTARKNRFDIELDIRWGDVDSFNHVSNAAYLRYLEECRAVWMEQLRCDWQGEETGPVVANININYRRPLHWPARISVSLAPQSPGRSSIKLEHEIRTVPARKDKQPVLCADGTVTLVWIDKKKGEPVPLPSSVRKAGE